MQLFNLSFIKQKSISYNITGYIMGMCTCIQLSTSCNALFATIRWSQTFPLTCYFFFFFLHLYSFNFDASMWWRHSMKALTFPIRLAQCGSVLLISNNAMATVVASVFSGLPPSHLPHCFPPNSSLLPSSFFIPLRWAVVLHYDAQFGERQPNCRKLPHAALAICMSEE